MSIMNLGLYGFASERPPIDSTLYPGMEAKFRQQRSTAELRATAIRYPKFKEGALHALTKVHGEMMARFTQLSLKGEPFQEGQAVTEAEAEDFFNVGRSLFFGAGSTLHRGDMTRKMLSEGRLKQFIDTHVVADPYKLEITKECWRQQLIKLRNDHAGELPAAAVERLYLTFKCPFGCPPPMTDPIIFVDMHNVPRPRQKAGCNKYDDFDECFGQPTPSVLPPLQEGEITELATSTVLQKEKARSIILCSDCSKPRVVYVDARPSSVMTNNGRTSADDLADMLSENKESFTCGNDLDLTGFKFSERTRPWVRVKLSCSSLPESQLFSSTVLSEENRAKTCGWCGLLEGQRAPEDGEATIPLPVCGPCLVQLKKGRSSGKPKMDRGGRRASEATAATARATDISVAQSKDTVHARVLSAAKKPKCGASEAMSSATPSGSVSAESSISPASDPHGVVSPPALPVHISLFSYIRHSHSRTINRFYAGSAYGRRRRGRDEIRRYSRWSQYHAS